jgi:hypothetical protein
MQHDGTRLKTYVVGGFKTKDEYDTVIEGLRANPTVREIQR